MINADFECSNCEHIFEVFLVDRETKIEICPKCSGLSRRILSFRGAYRADPLWLPSAVKVLQADGERPIESRSEHDRYLKERDISHRC